MRQKPLIPVVKLISLKKDGLAGTKGYAQKSELGVGRVLKLGNIRGKAPKSTLPGNGKPKGSGVLGTKMPDHCNGGTPRKSYAGRTLDSSHIAIATPCTRERILHREASRKGD